VAHEVAAADLAPCPTTTTDYQILITTPGWSVIRAAALDPRTRWASAAELDRAHPDPVRVGRPPRRQRQPRRLVAFAKVRRRSPSNPAQWS
jgi:hypothetical protein